MPSSPRLISLPYLFQMPLEREVKLRFVSGEAARAAILHADVDAALLRARRLQTDHLLDTEDRQLYRQRCALRVRDENGTAVLTFKGPVQPGTMKIRDEHETTVSDRSALLAILHGLGFRVWFTYQKYREEFRAADVIIAVDETPIGTFVEIEGTELGIDRAAAALRRTSTDYITASYRTLYVEHCESRGFEPRDMVFE
jgi:adenylate cyclase, class 2